MTGRRGQPEPEGGNHGPKEALSTKLKAGFIANQDFLGFWTVNIHLRRGTGCTPRRAAGEEAISCSDRTHQTPGYLSCLFLGRAQKAGPTESAPLWSTREPEPEWLRPGKCTQPRAHLRRFPCRATWKLSNVDWESTPTTSGGKPSVAQTLQALPTHTSDICLQCSSLPVAQLNKLA